MTNAGVGEGVLGQRAGHQRLDAVGPVVVQAPLGDLPVDLAVDVADALVEPRLVEVGHHDRHLQPAGEQQRELARHQTCAHDPDLGDGAGECLVRRTRGLPGPPLHEVERVQPGPQLVGHDEVGERLVLGGEALVAGGRAGQSDQLEGPVGGRCRAVHPGVRDGLATGERGRPGGLAPVHLAAGAG